MKTTKIFISYAHKDEDWKNQIVMHLSPLSRSGQLDIWDDSHIDSGDEWTKTIAEVVNTADIAVLLISAPYLASDFIQN